MFPIWCRIDSSRKTDLLHLHSISANLQYVRTFSPVYSLQKSVQCFEEMIKQRRDAVVFSHRRRVGCGGVRRVELSVRRHVRVRRRGLPRLRVQLQLRRRQVSGAATSVSQCSGVLTSMPLFLVHLRFWETTLPN